MNNQNVHLIRGYTMRKLKEIRFFVCTYCSNEIAAIEALNGTKGVQTAARICDFIMSELGHSPPGVYSGDSTTRKAARKAMDAGA